MNPNDKNVADNDGLPNDYRTSNKLDFILDSSKTALQKCKDHFYAQLEKYCAVEKGYCRKVGIPEQMVGDKKRHIIAMLEQAPDYYWVECLAQFVFDECAVPSQRELEAKYARIKALGNLWLPSRDKSYTFMKGYKGL